MFVFLSSIFVMMAPRGTGGLASDSTEPCAISCTMTPLVESSLRSCATQGVISCTVVPHFLSPDFSPNFVGSFCVLILIVSFWLSVFSGFLVILKLMLPFMGVFAMVLSSVGMCTLFEAFTGMSLMCVMRSPGWSPAIWAGDFCTTEFTRTPLVSPVSFVVLRLAPIHDLSTVPCLMSVFAIFFAWFAGMAKPIEEPPLALTPMILPCRSTSGPPELPGFMSASCCIQIVRKPVDAAVGIAMACSGRMRMRCVFETTPFEIDFESESGEPIAMTASEDSSLSESPNCAMTRFLPWLISLVRSSFRTAMSVSGSEPTSVAGISWLSLRVQMNETPCSTTCAFVTT